MAILSYKLTSVCYFTIQICVICIQLLLWEGVSVNKNDHHLLNILQKTRIGSFPIIFVIAGSGQIARYAIEGGAHFLMVLNAGLYRISGVSSLASFLPFGNANDQTEKLLRVQILPRALKTPIVAGVMANDPVLPLTQRLKRLSDLGVAGVTNWPAVGLIDGKFRGALAQEGFSVRNEIKMLLEAKKHGFVTCGFVFSIQEAVSMANAGVDVLILNFGWTHETHNIYEKGDRIQYTIVKINEMVEAVSATGSDPIYLYYGGSITLPEDSAELYQRTKVHGYGGGSSFERIPIANLVTNTIKQFSSIPRIKDSQQLGQEMGELVGVSPAMLKLYRLIEKVAPYDVNVCIEGESGVGKELVATQLHRLSYRISQPFITLNCGAIPDTLLESEFFGHEKGSFTGAVTRRIGKFELADHGTLLLDEVSELSPKAQVSLLRVLQQKQITRVGGEKVIPVDVRIITATHQNLKEMVAEERFRADLYFRLNMITLKVPPLRYRIHDIPVLVNRFLNELGAQFGHQVLGITPEFMRLLMKHSWPGNIRELKHVICRAILLEDGPILKGEDFNPEFGIAKDNLDHQEVSHLSSLVKNTEYNAVMNTIQATGGNKSKAAKLLGISRKTLYSRLKHLDHLRIS